MAYVLRLFAFAAAAFVGGIAMGAVVGALGAASSMLVGGQGTVVFALGVAIVVILGDVARPRSRAAIWSPHWQVPQGWAAYGSPFYEAAFGAILGAGVFTVVPFATYWVLLALIFAIGDVSAGLVAMGSFGIARSIPMLATPFLITRAQTARTPWAVEAARMLTRFATAWPMRVARVSAAGIAVALLYRLLT